MGIRFCLVAAFSGMVALLVSACLDRELTPLTPCLVSGVSRVVKVEDIHKVDLLMMVDNSQSMASKQASLRTQFPNLIRVLTAGRRFEGDPNPFPAVKDLHVGVVSSDMGVPGVDVPGTPCRANGGDDGRLLHVGRSAGCQADYPTFLSFIGDASLGPLGDPVQFVHDVSCIADLGTGGCGFEQQLEAPFKALWPKVQLDASGNAVPNQYRFISITEEGTWGRGDQPAALGGNLGFLRNDSLIAILVVTDEEDCSVSSTEHLKSRTQLPPDSPYLKEDINLRCFHHKEFLYDVQRYYEGFRKLRPGHEQSVVFTAIAGVPVDLVSPDVLEKVDFTSNDASTRDAFYDAILNDRRMQEEIDPASQPGTGAGNLKPSCSRVVPGQAEPVIAYPPRRIVELAKRFGKNGVVQSICQDDFGPAMDAIINIIAANVDRACMPRPLVRQANGKVRCDLIWELPRSAPAGAATTPTQCNELPFLSPVEDGQVATNAANGVNCNVSQLAVMDTTTAIAPAGDGWYYDDFSKETDKCPAAGRKQRIGFSAGARPPKGVTVKLKCVEEKQHLERVRKNLHEAAPQPEIGDACGAQLRSSPPFGDAACVVTLADGSRQQDLFCHAEWNTCVQKCSTDMDCPPAWRCDDLPDAVASGGQGAYCVNPTCGFEGSR